MTTRKRSFSYFILPTAVAAFSPLSSVVVVPPPIAAQNAGNGVPAPSIISLAATDASTTGGDIADNVKVEPTSLKSDEVPGEVQRVLRVMEEYLYPPERLEERIATSRKDGYWPFIRDGHDPPSEFVYGEFDLWFFYQVLQKAAKAAAQDTIEEEEEESSSSSFEDLVFTDLGSGTGRLVLAAAAFFPWKLCRGIELLEGIHQDAISKMELCRDGIERTMLVADDQLATSAAATQNQHFDPHQALEAFQPTSSGLWLESSSNVEDDSSDESEQCSTEQSLQPHTYYSLPCSPGEEDDDRIPLAPMEFHCGSFTDPYQYFGDSRILFCFSSCLQPETRLELAQSIGRQCLPGTIIITTEYALPLSGRIEESPDDPDLPHGAFSFEVLESLTGENESTGGLSTVYMHRLTQSVGDGVRRNAPILPLSEIAYRAIAYMETNHDARLFLQRVANDMVFAGCFPESWIPQPSSLDEEADEASSTTTTTGTVW